MIKKTLTLYYSNEKISEIISSKFFLCFGFINENWSITIEEYTDLLHSDDSVGYVLPTSHWSWTNGWNNVSNKHMKTLQVCISLK